MVEVGKFYSVQRKIYVAVKQNRLFTTGLVYSNWQRAGSLLQESLFCLSKGIIFNPLFDMTKVSHVEY